MSATKSNLSFDAFIQNERKKRKAEELAHQIFGKKGKVEAASNQKKAKPLPGGSLASRVGVTKRSASATLAPRSADNAKARQPSTLSRSATAARLETALDNTDVFKKRQPKSRQPARTELNIRGAAGPYTVVAQNFAPGTTAADIESVMQPVGGNMMSCRLVSSRPTVIAELVFLEKPGADAVIKTFNNQKADGRLLYVYLKSSSGADVPQDDAHVPAADATAVTTEQYDEPINEDRVMEEAQPAQQSGRLTPHAPESHGNGGAQQNSQNGGYRNGYDQRYDGAYGGRSQWQDRRHDGGGYYGGFDRRGGWGYGQRSRGYGGPPRNGSGW